MYLHIYIRLNNIQPNRVRVRFLSDIFFCSSLSRIRTHTIDKHLHANQCLSPLKLSVRIPLRRGVLDTTLCDKVYQWLATGRWFSPAKPASSTNKTDRHDITEILLKVALNTINQTIKIRMQYLYKKCRRLYIAWILVNIVPRNISYCTRKLVQYDILLGTIFPNIHAITLYHYWLKYCWKWR
jgi:hypothetical protein